MHGTNDDVDMRHYGALRTSMPVTFLTFAMGYLAIIGFPGFSGFWSKDKIIETALTDNWVVGLCALLGAGVTGFYMTRLMLMTFFGDKRWRDEVHPHESPRVMTIPLIVLAALSAIGGFFLVGDWIINWLAPVVGTAPEEHAPVPGTVVSVLAVLVVAAGVAIAWMIFGKRPIPDEAPTEVSFVTRAARADLYGDAANEELVIKPGYGLVRGLMAVDTHVVDGAAVGSATSVGTLSAQGRMVQNGFVRSYALALLLGATLVIAILMVVAH
jgi:NADH-quinone oxidoreductase subunit L